MTNNFSTFIDSDAFVGRYFPDDVHHPQTVAIFKQLEQQAASIVTSSLVVVETATVLSHRIGQEAACRFLDILERSQLPIIHINEFLHQEALTLFRKQTKKGTSVVDCANVTVIRRFNISTIFSFDKVYKFKFGISTYI